LTHSWPNYLLHFMNLNMVLNQLYFYTATIEGNKYLLKNDRFKDIIINTLQYLVFHAKIRVFAYVIMPDHVHFLWEFLEYNGDEYPHTSFINSSTYQFVKDLEINNPAELKQFEIETTKNTYQFWQKNQQAKRIHSQSLMYEKIDYIHQNPVHGKWKLVNEASDYLYSSALYYKSGIDKFGILTNVEDRL